MRGHNEHYLYEREKSTAARVARRQTSQENSVYQNVIAQHISKSGQMYEERARE